MLIKVLYKRGNFMYCWNCGKKIKDNISVCKHCGCTINQHTQSNNDIIDEQTPPVSKYSEGFWYGFTHFIEDLSAVLLLFKKGSYERKTFKKGFWFGIFVKIIAILLVFSLLAGGTIYYLLYFR